MRLAVLLIGLALAATACGEDDEQAASPSPAGGGASLADLKVTVDKDGDEGAGKPQTATVRCDAATDSDTCQAVADLKEETFKPTGGMTACTQQYGGPETATVTGTFQGKPVDAKFSRTDGCEISRWNEASKLLEAAG
jgi:hypothetical protein